jgi:ribosomal protein L32
MSVCPNCGSENAQTNRFCGACGTALAEGVVSDAGPEGAAEEARSEGSGAAGTGTEGPSEEAPSDEEQADGVPSDSAAEEAAGVPDAEAETSEGSLEPTPRAASPQHDPWSAEEFVGRPPESPDEPPARLALGTVPGRPYRPPPRPSDAATRFPSTTQPRPGLIACETCGAANSPTRAYCLNCGSRLARGAPTGAGWYGGRRRFLASGRILLLGVLAALVLAGGAGFLVFSGLFGGVLGGLPEIDPAGPGGPAGTSTLSAAATASASPSGSAGASGVTSASPSASASPAGPPPTTAVPRDTPRPRFACETTRVVDASISTWRILRATSDSRDRADVLRLVMDRIGTREAGHASLTVQILQFGELARRGLDRPSQGDVALVMSFRGVRAGRILDDEPRMRALREFRIVEIDNQAVAVLGVTGAGCFGIRAPAWADRTPPNSGEILVEIRNR